LANTHLSNAKTAKNDEFYTQYVDIEKEINSYLDYNPNVFKDKTILLPCDDPEWSNFTRYFAQNFQTFGLKKLISTSYAVESKKNKLHYKPTIFETQSHKFDANKTRIKGKLFILENKKNDNKKIDVRNLDWKYLENDGDFRSKEIQSLCNESDIIITNPPFSLFREFITWIIKTNKKFIIIGNLNAITYKEVFPLIKKNKLWLGNGFHSGSAYFTTPIKRQYATGEYNNKSGLVKFGNCCWFTNLDHGRRHKPLSLMALLDNVKFSKHKKVRGKSYFQYDNYEAIEVPFVDAIPSDYDGVMGVPISFLHKYSPEQFEILGMCENLDLYKLKTKIYTSTECRKAYFTKFNKKGIYDLNASGVIIENGRHEKVYQRILIKHKRKGKCKQHSKIA